LSGGDVVYLAVTIVVFAVADFCFGYDGWGITNELFGCGITNEFAATFACSLSFGAGSASYFVDLTITIVVESITDFCFGSCLSYTNAPLSVGAGPSPLLASACTATTCLRLAIGALATFVNASIAVVVFLVASFCGGDDLSCTGSPYTAFAGLPTGLAVSDACRSLLSGIAFAR
jgi:hypothetical protein